MSDSTSFLPQAGGSAASAPHHTFMEHGAHGADHPVVTQDTAASRESVLSRDTQVNAAGDCAPGQGGGTVARWAPWVGTAKKGTREHTGQWWAGHDCQEEG